MRRSSSFFVHHPQRIRESREHDDRGAVLVVVEDRDVQQFAEARLHLETPRRRDVLEVDAAVGRGDDLHGADDLVHILGVQTHRPRVDTGKALEQCGFSFHHGHGRLRADVAETQDGRPVGDDCDRIALDGEPAGVRLVRGDGQADPGDTRGVGAGQIVAILQRDGGVDLELAAEVDQKGPIADLAHVDAGDVPHRLGDAVGMLDIHCITGDVDQDSARVRLHHVQCGQRPSGGGHGGGQLGRGTHRGRHLHAQGDGVAGTGRRHRRAPNR
jgi:hypothetical protein